MRSRGGVCVCVPGKTVKTIYPKARRSGGHAAGDRLRLSVWTLSDNSPVATPDRKPQTCLIYTLPLLYHCPHGSPSDKKKKKIRYRLRHEAASTHRSR